MCRCRCRLGLSAILSSRCFSFSQFEGGVKCDSIHGDKEQWERTEVLNKFKSSALKILVATDVAARGLDVKDIDTVINYDFPHSGLEDYVHRIGRTGRAEKTGEAHTLFTKEDSKFAHDYVKMLRDAKQVS